MSDLVTKSSLKIQSREIGLKPLRLTPEYSDSRAAMFCRDLFILTAARLG
jgi:hypothetical protein